MINGLQLDVFFYQQGQEIKNFCPLKFEQCTEILRKQAEIPVFKLIYKLESERHQLSKENFLEFM